MIDEEVHLSMSVQGSLRRLQSSNSLMNKLIHRSQSGLKVENISDDPVAFFRSQSLADRSDVFSERKDSIDQALSAMDSSLTGIDSLKKILEQVKGLLHKMKESSTTYEFNSQASSVAELMDQYDKLARDASYSGVNLLTSTREQLDVLLSQGTDRKISIKGLHLLATRPILSPDPKEKTFFYNPLMDETLLEALQKQTDIYFGMEDIEGYTRLLGFGFSLFGKAADPRGYGTMVDAYIELIGGARKAGSVHAAILKKSFLNLLQLADMGYGMGLSKFPTVIQTGSTKAYRNGYRFLRFLGFAGTDMTGPLTKVSYLFGKIEEIVAIATSHPSGKYALDLQDRALLRMALNGNESKVLLSLVSSPLKVFLSQLFSAGAVINKQSRYLILEGLLNKFTYEKETIGYSDWLYFQEVYDRLKFAQYGDHTRLMSAYSIWIGNLLTKKDLSVEYPRLFKVLLLSFHKSPTTFVFGYSNLQASAFKELLNNFTFHKGNTKLYVDGQNVFTIVQKLLGRTFRFQDYFSFGNPFTNPQAIAPFLRGNLPQKMSLFFSQVFATQFYYTSGELKKSGYLCLANHPTFLLRTKLPTGVSPLKLTRFYSPNQTLHFLTSHLQFLDAPVAEKVEEVIKNIFGGHGLGLRPLDDHLKLVPSIFVYQNKYVREIIEKITVHSVAAPPTVSTDANVASGTTAFGFAVEWLQNMDFDRVYKSGELSKELDVSINNVEKALKSIDSAMENFSSIITILEIRLDFTSSYVNHMKIGAGKLVLADTNENGAKLAAIQTRVGLGTRLLGIAGQQEEKILDLLRY